MPVFFTSHSPYVIHVILVMQIGQCALYQPIASDFLDHRQCGQIRNVIAIRPYPQISSQR